MKERPLGRRSKILSDRERARRSSGKGGLRRGGGEAYGEEKEKGGMEKYMNIGTA